MFCKGDLLSLFKFNRKLCNIFDPSQKKKKNSILSFPYYICTANTLGYIR